MKRRMNLGSLIIVASALLHFSSAFDEYSYQQIINKQNSQPLNGSLLITKLLNLNGSREVPSSTPHRVNSVKINQSIELTTSDRVKEDDDQSLADKSLLKNPKYVNKGATSADKKNSMLLKKNLSVSQLSAAQDDNWKCPNITDNRSLECGCNVRLTLRCSGDVHGLSLIAEGLRRSSSFVSILDCQLRNVTVLNEARIFEGVSISGLFISSGEIKRVHRSAFSGLKIPLQILGLPNNALTNVPSNSLQQLTSLDRLDLSNNQIKTLSPTDFVSLMKLTYLEISENQISLISPKTFLPLKNLVTLKLNGNKLGDSPNSLKTIAECINLRELDLQSNLIKGPLTANILPKLKDLEELNLGRNTFSSVEGGSFNDFSKLLTLSLRYNQIDVLADDAFAGLTSLQKLDLSYNGIVAVSEASLKHMNRLTLLDFTHNFLRAITSDMITPLPQLQDIRLDGNDISIVEKNAMNNAKNLTNLSLRDNPLSCDCKLQYFAEWFANASNLVSKDLMAFCKTPPVLEGAQLSQLPIESLTCAENYSETENDEIMNQINSMFNDVSDNFTMINSSSTIKFLDYNFTTSSVLNLNWMLHLSKANHFHSLLTFEGSNVKMRFDKSKLNYRTIPEDNENEESFLVSVPADVALNLGSFYEFCLIFTEDDYHFFVGCSTSFVLLPHRIGNIDLNSRILKSTINSDISSFDAIADSENNPLFMNDDLSPSYAAGKRVKKIDLATVQDDSIEVYPSREYFNSLWPNLSLSILIICMSISIIYILWTKYRLYYKHHQTDSISPSYSEESINTQLEDENENMTSNYVKLQATTTL